jgi:PD-(D/E)XK nuclease superfamily
LDEFKKVPGRISRPQTFMEIGGYPHYENVCSNFLAFFFDPEGPHGLGSLFLDALVGAVGVEGVEEGLGGNVSVEREVFTGAGNRIDLLIKSDSHAVLIENKIFAAVANPFEDYAASAGCAFAVVRPAFLLTHPHPASSGSLHAATVSV